PRLRTTRANWRMLPETAIWGAQPGYRSCSKEILKTFVNAMRGVVAPTPTGLSLANQQPDPRERIDSVGDERAVLLGAPIQQPASALRALVAEDDPMFRRILQSWLEAWGHEVT